MRDCGRVGTFEGPAVGSAPRAIHQSKRISVSALIKMFAEVKNVGLSSGHFSVGTPSRTKSVFLSNTFKEYFGKEIKFTLENRQPANMCLVSKACFFTFALELQG